MRNKKIIALIGLMGVGKTTIGAKLAEKLRFYFVDMDQEIEDFERKNIAEIFSQKGEKYFRQVERKIVAETVFRDEEMVLSLGGGAFIDEETRKILKEKAVVIWLQASIEDILYRIGNKNNRPLLNQKDKRKILKELALKRYPIYSQADLIFDTSKENHEAIIGKIIAAINRLKNE
jgi:shikimate kinase